MMAKYLGLTCIGKNGWSFRFGWAESPELGAKWLRLQWFFPLKRKGDLNSLASVF